MTSRLILIVGNIFLTSLMFQHTSAVAEEKAKLPQQAIEYILDLESEDFQARQKATSTLPDYGVQVIEPLMKVAHGDSLEAAVRAILVIESIYVKGKADSVSKAEDALDTLTRAKNPSVAIRAEEAIDRHSDIRKKRAIREIKKMGGNVKLWTAKTIAIAQKGNSVVPGQVRFIALGSKWTGKEHGLRYLKRVGRFEALYLIKGHPFSELAMDDLVKGLSGTPYQIRNSEAMLGITSTNNPNDQGWCEVGSVSEGLAAQKAGIQAEDLIVKFDGQPVQNFEALVDLIGKKAPHDTVDIELLRDKTLMTLKVTLSSWVD